MNNSWLYVLCLCFLFSCSKNSDGIINETLHVRHLGADMPVHIHGNLESDVLLIIVHGAGSFGLAYRSKAMQEEVESRYLVAYFDQRGQSMSEGHYQDPDDLIELMSSDLSAITSVLQNKYGSERSLFLMGHSWGGLLSGNTLLDQEFRDKYNGWINVAGLLNTNLASSYRQELIIEVADTIGPLSDQSQEWLELKNEVSLLDPNIQDDYSKILKSSGKAIKLLLQHGEVDQSISNLTLYRALIENNPIHWQVSHFFNKPVQAALDKNYTMEESANVIDLPTLFIYGKYDFSVPPDIGREILQILGTDNKSIEIFDNSIHHPYDSEPDKFSEILISFIEEHR